jgi:site-specific recombinase XerD
MAQHSKVDQAPFSYSRADFAALRAWVQRVPVNKIAETYYSDDAPQVARDLEKFLVHMRSDLIDRAILANPLFADSLAKARLGGAISVGVLNVLIKAADATPLPPGPEDLIAQWFRRKVAEQLVSQGIKKLDELKRMIESRGPNWWRSIPRIGQLRAQAIVGWMNKYPSLAIARETQIQAFPTTLQVVLTEAPLPLERISALPSMLDGSKGDNRAELFCYLQAKNDLEAIRAYLSGFKDQEHTHRAYQRELERLLLWAVLVRQKPLSSLLVHDCEAYKDCLAAPPPALTGPRTGRFTPRWRPFVGALSPSSQRQAVQIIRTAFSWLASVRYLGGNPWLAVKDPRSIKHMHPMQIERALRTDLWMRVLDRLQIIGADPEAKQARAGRAAIMLMGGIGLRSSEAAKAKLAHLQRSSFAKVAELKIVGKGDVERIVPLSSATIAAIEEHWADHSQSLLDEHLKGMALVRPLVVPATPKALARHEKSGQGYTPVALSRLAKETLMQVADSEEFEAHERAALRHARAHDLRHTFATQAVSLDMPLDVTQRILGHSSLATTSIYVRAEQRRVAIEAEKLFKLQAARPSTDNGDNLVDKTTS